MASERAAKWVKENATEIAKPGQINHNSVGWMKKAYDAGYTQGAADKEDEIRALREAIIQEVHRHWLFLKYEKDNGGNYEHLNTRMVEAEYIEGRIRALLAGETKR